MSNSIDPDETAHYEPSHLDLCCLQKPIIIACGSERAKQRNTLKPSLLSINISRQQFKIFSYFFFFFFFSTQNFELDISSEKTPKKTQTKNPPYP